MAEIIVTEKYVKVINSDNSIAVNNYFKSARIETNQTLTQGETLADITAVGLPVLPASGWIEKDKLYNYNSVVVHCIQGHNRTIYTPSETPALFATYRVNSDVLNWIENEKVVTGWKRIYNSKAYQVIQAHMTQQTWNPELTLGVLWQTVATSSAWTIGVAYKVGDIVTYQTKSYKCLQAHTSIATWYPSAVPALWQLQ